MKPTDSPWEDVPLDFNPSEKTFQNPAEALNHIFYAVALEQGYKMQRRTVYWQDSSQRRPPEPRHEFRIAGPDIIKRIQHIMRKDDA